MEADQFQQHVLLTQKKVQDVLVVFFSITRRCYHLCLTVIFVLKSGFCYTHITPLDITHKKTKTRNISTLSH